MAALEPDDYEMRDASDDMLRWVAENFHAVYRRRAARRELERRGKA